jgi:hypothetical protein
MKRKCISHVYDCGSHQFSNDLNKVLSNLQDRGCKIIDVKHSVSTCYDKDEFKICDTFSALIIFEEKE